jgi:hypothetical protein
MPSANERRKFWRATFNAPVKVINDASSSDAWLDDISLKGALIEVPANWAGKAGEHCHLKLRLGTESDTVISMWGKITHVEGQKVGVQCESIDLDSITHLRRLVELNSGDPAQLDRDLAALVHGD